MFAERGGDARESESDAVANCEIALLSLPSSDIAREVCEQHISSADPSGLLVIDTTTGDPEDSIDIAAHLLKAGIGYVDAAISGNASQAARKDIVFMVGGPDALVTRSLEILEPMCRAIHHVGGVGAGSRFKLIINHVLSVNRAAPAEGLTVAEKSGLDLTVVLEVLRDGAAYSRAMDIWGDRMISGDHWPPASRIRQGLKDSDLINVHADRVGASRALVSAVRKMLAEADAGCLSDADNSSITEVMRRRASIGRYGPE